MVLKDDGQTPELKDFWNNSKNTTEACIDIMIQPASKSRIALVD